MLKAVHAIEMKGGRVTKRLHGTKGQANNAEVLKVRHALKWKGKSVTTRLQSSKGHAGNAEVLKASTTFKWKARAPGQGCRVPRARQTMLKC